RALLLLLFGWAIAFAAEWASSAGPGIPFGVYHYRRAGLTHDWTLFGVPIFDSVSFTWLAFCTYTVTGALGARGWRRILLGAVAMVALDLVVDPVALRGAHWWLGSIYSYPAHLGIWYGVSPLNYLGWLVVGALLQSWIHLLLGDFPAQLRWPLLLSSVLLLGVVVQSSVLAVLLGVGPSALVALVVLVACLLLASGPAPHPPTGSGPPLILACALASEARSVRRTTGRGWTRMPAGSLVRWLAAGGMVEVWETGTGPDAAGRAAGQAPSGALVLVLGVAGACVDGWNIGDVGVGERVRSLDGRWLELSPDAYRVLSRDGIGRSCQLGTSPVVVETAAARAAEAGHGVELVEMETASWAQCPGARVAALRVVLDTPSRPLGPGAGLVLVDGHGPAPWRLAGLLLRHPRAVSQLVALGRLQALALGELGRAAGIAVASLEQAALVKAGLQVRDSDSGPPPVEPDEQGPSPDRAELS
ncbi:MAG: carotenoid biosynthesis protein, partial [Candidatus Dormibacteria bacterium]